MNLSGLVRGAAALVALRIAAPPAAAHGADHATGHSPWTRWAAIAALVLGVAMVGVGVFLDRRSEERHAGSDTLVVVGTIVALLSMAFFWL